MHYEFEQKQDELKELLNQYTQKRADINQAELVKVIHLNATQIGKES